MHGYGSFYDNREEEKIADLQIEVSKLKSSNAELFEALKALKAVYSEHAKFYHKDEYARAVRAIENAEKSALRT